MSHALHTSFRLFALAVFCVSTVAVAFAAGTSTAEGTLTVKGSSNPLSVKLAHAYYFVGPDAFDKTKTIRNIVFTASDKQKTIEACTNTSCADLSSVDGLEIGLTESGNVKWWAHIAPMQYASSDISALTLDVDTPKHVAGTFKLGGSADANVTVSVKFDATLIKTFPAKK